MGVCGVGWYDDEIQLGSRDWFGECELRWLRQPMGFLEDGAGRQFRGERLWPLRHAREPLGMGRRLLAQYLRRRTVGWFVMGEKRVLQHVCSARRFLVLLAGEPPFGEPLQERVRQTAQRRLRVPSFPDRFAIAKLTSLFLTSLPRGAGGVARGRNG